MSDSLLMAFGRVIGALAPIFLAVLSWLAIRVAALINARVKAERVRSALHRLDDAVFTAVREVEQVLVVSLKTASADGSLTDAERAEVKGAAIDAVRKYVGAKGWLQVGTVLGLSTDELERVLAARVETAVYDLRGHPARGLSNVLRKALGSHAAPPPHTTNGSQ